MRGRERFTSLAWFCHCLILQLSQRHNKKRENGKNHLEQEIKKSTLECIREQTHCAISTPRWKNFSLNFPFLLSLDGFHNGFYACVQFNVPWLFFQLDWIYPGIFATFMLWIFHQKHREKTFLYYWKISHAKSEENCTKRLNWTLWVLLLQSRAEFSRLR
jgi:hypothetical protein